MESLLLSPVYTPDSNKEDNVYEVEADISRTYEGVTITVPKYFQYDGASIPAFAWHIVDTPFAPRLMLASVFHDWIYHTHQIKRAQADTMFYTLLRASGVSEEQAQTMTTAVRIAGGLYWKNDAKDKAYIRRLADRIRADNRDPAKYGIA